MIKATKGIDQAYRIDEWIKKQDEKRSKQRDKIDEWIKNVMKIKV